MSIRTRLECDARFVSWIVFTCHIPHSICERESGDRVTCTMQLQELESPCRKPQLSPRYKIRYCVFTAPVLWFPGWFPLLLSFSPSSFFFFLLLFL